MSTTSSKASARGWALITGASAGLGFEFARQLAARGHDVILTARRRERMEKLAADLQAKHGIQALVLESDLMVPGAAAALVKELDARGIVPAVLINNAGFGPHGAALDVPVEKTTEMLNLNMVALTELTILIGGKMAARGSGGIVNVASTAAFQPSPYFAAYSATKSYVASFTQAFAREVAPRGVRVVTHCPGPTRTEFFDVADLKVGINDALVMSAERCVRIGLHALDRGRPLVITGWLNAIVAWFARVSPLWMVVPITGWIMRPRPTTRALPAAKR
jgi:short-subunit dehydrogenase